LTKRILSNWWEAYLQYTASQESPDVFHAAVALSCLAAAVGRKVWVDRKFYRIYPNHYFVIVAKSAECRKSVAVGIGRSLLEESGIIEPCSERLTNAALWLALDTARKEKGRSEIFLFADELSLFLSKEDAYKGVINTLTRLYTCPDYVKNTTKTAGVDHAVNVCVNTLFATTPTDLAELIPGAATGKGFTPRLHLVYGEKSRGRIADIQEDKELRKMLIQDLQWINTLQGEFIITKDGWEWWADWYKNMKFPENYELDGWYGRKHDYIIKAAMLFSVAVKDELVLDVANLQQGLMFLNMLEQHFDQLYGVVGQIPMAAHRQRIIQQMARRGGRVSRADLLHLNHNRMTSIELTEVMNMLEQEGMIVIERMGKVTYYRLLGGGSGKENSSVV